MPQSDRAVLCPPHCGRAPRLHIADHELLDGTPILDINPYLPYCDSHPAATIGCAAALDPAAADHRQWWRDKGVAPPARYGRWIARRGDSGPLPLTTDNRR